MFFLPLVLAFLLLGSTISVPSGVTSQRDKISCLPSSCVREVTSPFPMQCCTDEHNELHCCDSQKKQKKSIPKKHPKTDQDQYYYYYYWG